MKYLVVVADSRRVGSHSYRDGSISARTAGGNGAPAANIRGARFALANTRQATLDRVDDRVLLGDAEPVESGYVAEELLHHAFGAQGIVDGQLPHLQRIELKRMVTAQ